MRGTATEGLSRIQLSGADRGRLPPAALSLSTGEQYCPAHLLVAGKELCRLGDMIVLASVSPAAV
jgi:hypothetical protein